MKPNVYLSVFGVLGILFGLAFLAAPAPTMEIYGVSPETSGIVLGRYFGVALVGTGVLNILCRDVHDPAALRGLLVGNAVAGVCGTAVALWQIGSGLGNVMVWSTVVIYAALAAGGLLVWRTASSETLVHG